MRRSTRKRGKEKECQSIELCIVSGRAGWQAQWRRRLREAWEGLSDDGQREGEMGADFGRKVEKKKKWLILSFVSLSCKVVAIESNLELGEIFPIFGIALRSWYKLAASD